jgi:hypothetical protein
MPEPHLCPYEAGDERDVPLAREVGDLATLVLADVLFWDHAAVRAAARDAAQPDAGAAAVAAFLAALEGAMGELRL